MSEQSLSLADVDLINPELFSHGDPHATWRLLRREDPVAWHEGTEWFPGFWSVTKYQDVITVSRDPATFISSKGITMGTNPDDPSPAAGLGKMLIVTDPPRHVRLRRLVNKGFTPRMVNQMEPHIREITTGIIDAIAGRGEADFVVDVAAQLPLAVICSMMGVERQDWNLMFDLTNKVLGGDDPEYQEQTAGGDDLASRAAVARATIDQGAIQMFGYFARLAAERRQHRRDDLLSVLVEAEIDGEKLTDEEVLYFCFLLIVAGNETTRNAISGGMLALLENPEQKARLLAEPALIDSAVEEVLRYVSPVMHMMRTATRQVQLGGKTIKEGDRLILWYPSANRDEEVFADPDAFDIGRTPNEHLAFGIGEHFCLGAGFARLELKVMFQELLRRTPDLELNGEVERLRSNFIGGIKHMPVRFTPERVPATV